LKTRWKFSVKITVIENIYYKKKSSVLYKIKLAACLSFSSANHLSYRIVIELQCTETRDVFRCIALNTEHSKSTLPFVHTK